ncbi:MAG: deoxyribonuclease IV [Tannerella sp.]|jgi:deoxyribonuclease-4|nr:deoxyribonuclease IV [Tannerella sp.]
MFKIGCHLSSSKGFFAMGKEAVSIGANTFQFFTRNPRGGSAKAIDKKDVADFLVLARDNHISSLVAHSPYTLNACSADPQIRKFAEFTMDDDLQRMENVPGNFYNFHPGSHVGQGVETGINLIAGLLNKILKPEQTTIVLLETMAGKGSEIGGCFEELQTIIERVELNHLIGVCLDTCHVYDAGYDVVDHLDDVLEQFDQSIGLNRLRAIHLNDSMFGFKSHKDRHAKIGEGKIGIEAITRIINHPALHALPFNLETPNELEGYASEIGLLKGLYKR